ncbi:MAG TPA: LiaF domain-containing protein [Hanamia sp.]|nr:LiaF domain-containing protein [Hanamia sp.]
MEQNEMERFGGTRRPRIWSGLFLLVVGLLLLGYKMGAPIPGWIFTWPVLLIAIGLFVGARSRFHNPGSFIMILIGSIFLIDQQIPGIEFHNYIAPIILIGLGLLFILRPRSHSCRRNRRWNRMNPPFSPEFENQEQEGFKKKDNSPLTDNGEYIDVVAVFGGVKKNVQSKNFKGGEIVSFMGGSEINFMQADIQHPIELEVNNVFGGTKLIIPSNWDVKNEISAVFGGVDDKRNFNNSVPDTNKRIVLKGSCVFGGIEFTNY